MVIIYQIPLEMFVMKKLSMLLLMVGVIATGLVPMRANAQKGEKTLGIMAGYAGHNDGGYTDVYFQYSFAEHLRISGDLGYVFRNENKSAFLLDVDMHFPFKVYKGIAVYPLGGFTFNNWSYKHGDSTGRVGLNVGGGVDFYITSYLKLTAQAKYSLMNDTSGVFAGIGIGYVF